VPISISRPETGRTALFGRILGLFTTEPVNDWARVVVATDQKARQETRLNMDGAK